LAVSLASTADEVRAIQRLRWQVFVEEMGARLNTVEAGIESDRFDPFCQHLVVRDLDTGRIVGGYRILTDTQAKLAGGFYSATEFNMDRILTLPGRFMEVGRTCVNAAYRHGGTIALLWQGLARYLVINRFDAMIGCASVPLRTGTDEAALLYQMLSEKHLSAESARVFPRRPLPRLNLAGVEQKVIVPPLIKAYVRAGAKICGEPAWDTDFNVADLFIMLRADDIDARYARHFLARAA
jgi:putative hemolysin